MCRRGRHALAGSLCDRGLQFSPEGADRAKLLLRKAQSWLERPAHADPDKAVELLQVHEETFRELHVSVPIASS